MKKISALLMSAALLAVTLAGCGTGSNGPKVIGINQYGEHASLDNCREGFIEGLKEAGLVEGTDFTVDYQNAGFDDAIATQISQNFASKNVDLMCGIATNSATACLNASEDKNIPVIFTAVTDPVKAKLTEVGATVELA